MKIFRAMWRQLAYRNKVYPKLCLVFAETLEFVQKSEGGYFEGDRIHLSLVDFFKRSSY
jgi:hypothetical protein